MKPVQLHLFLITLWIFSEPTDLTWNELLPTFSTPPPKVDIKTPIRLLKRTLDYLDYVLVEKDGDLVGILTRFDLMRTLGEIIKN